jgi:biopolymer transport protein ExbB
MSMLDLMLRGGPLMWPIALCSIIAAYVIVERWIVLRRAQIDGRQFMAKLRSIYRHGDAGGAMAFIGQKDAPIANIIRRGMQRHGMEEEKIREAIENAGREEVFHLDRHLGILASIGGVAPMLGFLGTVTGMIGAFRIIELRGGIVTPSDLAGGIWEALLTTAFGLIVGIPALLLYNYFVARVKKSVFEMEVATVEFLEMLEQPPVATPTPSVVEPPPPRPLSIEHDVFRKKD